MLTRWQRIASSIVHRNPWWSVRCDEALLPTGAPATYYSVETPGSVMIIPIDDAGRFVCVRQYRFLNERDSIEFPGGGVRTGQDALAAAAAELAEEAGLTGSLEHIGSFNPFNGVTSERCDVFVARALTPAPAAPDVTEEFELVHLDAAQFDAAIADGSLWDGMTLAAHRIHLAASVRFRS